MASLPCLLCQLPWCSWLCRESCMAEGLLGVVCAHVGHCWGHLSSLGLPAGGPGASTSCRDSRPGVGAAAGFLVQGVPDAPHCWLLHPTEMLPQISEAYFKVLFSRVPKDVMQSIGPQAAAWRPQGDLGFIRLQVQEPVSGSVQCVFSSLCQFPLGWLSTSLPGRRSSTFAAQDP